MVLLRDVSPYGLIELEYDKSSCFGEPEKGEGMLQEL